MEPAELLRLAKKEKLAELESAWMAVIGEGACELTALLEVPEVLADRGRRELAESLLWYLSDSLKERGELRQALEVCGQGARLLPDSSVLRELIAELYAEVHQDRGDIADLIRVTLKSADLPLDEALAAIQNMMALKPGSYVLDPQHAQVGRVDGLDAEKGVLVVAFADGQKGYGPTLLGRLEPLGEDDFRALLAFERERLQGLAEDDPEELVRISLSALGPRMELRRLRLYLQPVVGSWSKWWAGVREALARSAVIGMTSGRSPSLFLRARPLSHGERLLRKFDSVEEPVARLSAALDVVREAREHGTLEPEAIQRVADEVAALGGRAAGQSLPLAVAAAAVAHELCGQFPSVKAPEVVLPDGFTAGAGGPAQLVRALHDNAVLLCALHFVRRRSPDLWQDFFASVVPLAERPVCEGIARELAGADARDALDEARRETLGRPDRSPGALAWLWRDCVRRLASDRPPAVDPPAVAMQLLETLASLVRAADLSEERRKEHIAELRGALFMRNGAALRQVLEDASPAQVAAVLGLGERNPALTDNMRADLVRVLRDIRPAPSEQAVPPWQEDVIYTTQAGIEKRRAELEHIANVRLPEIMREIGQAAAFGDVTDNAEYRAAVQERARLAERAARMQEEISEAGLITHEMASAEHVTVGSRVRVRNLSSGQVEDLTFLGPWDARPEEKIYAYNAPLALAFMGKGVGETVTFRLEAEERRWEILEIGPAV